MAAILPYRCMLFLTPKGGVNFPLLESRLALTNPMRGKWHCASSKLSKLAALGRQPPHKKFYYLRPPCCESKLAIWKGQI